MGAVKNHFHDEICALEHDDPISTCDGCAGFGVVRRDERNVLGTLGSTCTTCGGRGVVSATDFRPALDDGGAF